MQLHCAVPAEGKRTSRLGEWVSQWRLDAVRYLRSLRTTVAQWIWRLLLAGHGLRHMHRIVSCLNVVNFRGTIDELASIARDAVCPGIFDSTSRNLPAALDFNAIRQRGRSQTFLI